MNYSFLDFLQKVLGNGKYSKSTNEFLTFCPFCKHHKPKLSINVETQRWQCFPCGKASKKSVYYIIKEAGTKKDIQEYVKNYKPKKVNFELSTFNICDHQIILPDEFIPLICCKNSMVAGKKEWNYLTQRGFTEKDILKFKIGTAFRGKYKDRLILPSFDRKGNVNFFTSRLLRAPRGTNVYLTPEFPREYKNNIILNELNIDWTQSIVLVEGYFDMMKSIENTVPLFGSSLVKESKLFQKIVKVAKPVYLALDVDAEEKKIKIADMFLNNDIEVYNVDIKPFNDVGEMDKESFIKAYQNATLLTHENLLRRKIRNVR